MTTPKPLPAAPEKGRTTLTTRPTAGPWDVRRYRYEDGRSGGATAVVRSDGKALCQFTWTTKGTTADAFVMSASLDLLDAAERLLEHYSARLPQHLIEEFTDAVAKAKAVQP